MTSRVPISPEEITVRLDGLAIELEADLTEPEETRLKAEQGHLQYKLDQLAERHNEALQAQIVAAELLDANRQLKEELAQTIAECDVLRQQITELATQVATQVGR